MIIPLIRLLGDAISGYFIFLSFCILIRKRIGKAKVFTMGFALSLTSNILLEPIYNFLSDFALTYHLSYIFLNSLVTPCILFLFIWSLFKIRISNSILPLSCAYFAYVHIYLFSYTLAYWFLYPILTWIHPSIMNQYILFLFPFILIMYYFTEFLEKYHCYRFIENYYQKSYPLWKTYAISLLLLLLQGILHIWHGSGQVTSPYFIMLDFCIFIFALICMQFLLQLDLKQEKIQSMENSIAWQNHYVATLEEMQKEFRKFRHDYKNMMASLVLSSMDGQMKDQYLQELFIDFDQHIDKKMNMTRQLANIEVLEVKSLLMNKLTCMDKHKIPVVLEVLYPVDVIAMSIHEFNRCLGILLDNAIEEVLMHGGDISILFLKEEKYFQVIIENTLTSDVDITCIYQDGYSTKGDNRGIGLCTYQSIMDKYPNIYTSTTCEHGRFIQELRIEER